MKNDVAELFSRAGLTNFGYTELRQGEDIRASLERWPLLAKTVSELDRDRGREVVSFVADFFGRTER